MNSKISKETDVVWVEVEANRMTEDEAVKLICDAEMLISSWDVKERRREQQKQRSAARMKLKELALKQGHTEEYIQTMLNDLD